MITASDKQYFSMLIGLAGVLCATCHSSITLATTIHDATMSVDKTSWMVVARVMDGRGESNATETGMDRGRDRVGMDRGER